MASGDKMSVNCGIQLKADSVVLTYKVGKNVEQVSWDWFKEDDKYVAKFEAKLKNGDIKYHYSKPMDMDTHSKLGKQPSKKLDGDFYFVKLKKSSDVTDLHKYFDVPQ